MSLLTICQAAADETGLKKPSTIIGNTDQTAVRLLRFAIRTGRDLVKQDFPYLFKEHTDVTIASTVSYTLPTDFDHFTPFTQWNRTTSRRMFAIDPNFWQELQSGIVTTSINDRFRIRGKDRDFLLSPTPSAVETFSFEYVSKNYCQSAASAELSVWTADTDTGILDEELFELGIIWRILNRIGLPYAEEKAEYQRNIDTAKARLIAQQISLNEHRTTDINIPDTGYG